MDKPSVDNLPLAVREHLMRGQHDDAVALLKDTYQLDKAEAEQLIEDYRQALRERKLALDIQLANYNLEKEAKEQMHSAWTWGVRIALFIVCMVLIYFMAVSPTP